MLRRVPARGGGWQPVTGRLEPGEEPVDAAAREVREETGCEPLAVVDLGLDAEFTGFDGHRYRERAFLAEAPDGAEATTGAEHDAAEWLAIDEALARLTWEENRAALQAAARVLAEVPSRRRQS